MKSPFIPLRTEDFGANGCALSDGQFALTIEPRDNSDGAQIVMWRAQDLAEGKECDRFGRRNAPLCFYPSVESAQKQYRRWRGHGYTLIDVLVQANLLHLAPWHYSSVWDNETQAYWPIVCWKERLWGFPDSSKSGQPMRQVCILSGRTVNPYTGEMYV